MSGYGDGTSGNAEGFYGEGDQFGDLDQYDDPTLYNSSLGYSQTSQLSFSDEMFAPGGAFAPQATGFPPPTHSNTMPTYMPSYDNSSELMSNPVDNTDPNWFANGPLSAPASEDQPSASSLYSFSDSGTPGGRLPPVVDTAKFGDALKTAESWGKIHHRKEKRRLNSSNSRKAAKARSSELVTNVENATKRIQAARTRNSDLALRLSTIQGELFGTYPSVAELLYVHVPSTASQGPTSVPRQLAGPSGSSSIVLSSATVAEGEPEIPPGLDAAGVKKFKKNLSSTRAKQRKKVKEDNLQEEYNEQLEELEGLKTANTDLQSRISTMEEAMNPLNIQGGASSSA